MNSYNNSSSGQPIERHTTNNVNILSHIVCVPSEESGEVLSQRSLNFKNMVTGIFENIARKKLIQNPRVLGDSDLQILKNDLPNLNESHIEREIDQNLSNDENIDIMTQHLEDLDKFSEFLGINQLDTLVNTNVNMCASLSEVYGDFNFLGIPNTPPLNQSEILSENSTNVTFKPELVTGTNKALENANENYNISDDDNEVELIPCQNVSPPFQNSIPNFISDDDDYEIPCDQPNQNFQNNSYISELQSPSFVTSPPAIDDIPNSVSIQTSPLDFQNSVSTQTNSKITRNIPFVISKKFKRKNKRFSKWHSLSFGLSSLTDSTDNRSLEEKVLRIREVFDELIACHCD